MQVPSSWLVARDDATARRLVARRGGADPRMCVHHVLHAELQMFLVCIQCACTLPRPTTTRMVAMARYFNDGEAGLHSTCSLFHYKLILFLHCV